MNGFSHKQARRYMLLDLDGLLDDARRLDLQAHLDSCPACRADSEAFSTLMPRLQSEFHSRWDAHEGPSHTVMANVRSQTRRIIMSNRVKWGLGALGGVAVLILLGFGLNFLFSQLRDRSVAASVTPLPGNFMPVAAPNAEKRLLAFTMERNGVTDVYTVRADGSDLNNLTGDSNGSDPYWSPDGKRIAFNRNIGNTSQVFIMDADGSNVVQLTDDGDFNKLAAFEEGRNSNFSAWSPDGSKLVFVKLNFERANDNEWMKLFILDVTTKTQTPLTREWGAYLSPVWSPDGQQIAFSTFSRFDKQGNPTRLSVHIVSTDGSNPVELTGSLPDTFSIFIDWSSDGQSVIFSASNQTQDSMQVYEARLDGSMTELSQPIRASVIDWWNGTALAVDLRDNAFQWLRPDGTSSSLKVCPPEIYPSKYSSARSKAGGLFLGAQCSPGEWRLYLANEDGATARELVTPPLTAGDGSMVDQAWSPDGNFIAFNISSQSGPVEMFILDVARTLEDPTLEPAWFNVGEIFSSTDSLSWQPVITEETLAEKPAQRYEGLIAFTGTAEDGNTEIFIVRPDGSNLTNLTNNPATDESPAWSPDGRQIAFVSDRSGGRDIYLMNADGSNVRKLTDSSTFNDHFVWSPDGTKIVYFSSETHLFGDGNLMIINTDGSNKTALTSQPGKYHFLSWSPDGQYIVFQHSDSEENKATRILIADVNGSIVSDGPFFEGDTGRQHHQIHWESPNQFLTINSNLEQTLWGKWNITRFFTDGDNNRYNGSNPILASSETPIFAVFENTYVTAGEERSLTWFSYKGAPIPYSSWKMADSTCSKVFIDLQKSPDGEHGIVSAECEGGSTTFFLVNSDGSEIKQLGAALDNKIPLPFSVWSPDGKHILFRISNEQKTDYYRLDIDAMSNDSSTKPVQITTDGLYKFGAVWQPMP